MSQEPVKLGIVGLGRWAEVLTNAALTSDKLEIVSGYSRSAAKRDAYQAKDRKSTRLNSSHPRLSRMPSSA